MNRIMAALLVALAFAGCFGNESNESETEFVCETGFDADNVSVVDPSYDPINETHDHWEFGDHNIRTCTMVTVGWSALGETPHGYIGEIDFRGDLDLGAVAVLGNGEAPMIYLVDISNRTNPVVVSVIEQDGTYVTDVKISDDGGLLFAASQSVPAPGETLGITAGEPTTPAGFTVYDISDPSNPVYKLTVPDPSGLGCHMLSHEIIAGTDTLWCISSNVHVYRLDRAAGQVTTLAYVPYYPTVDGIPTPSAPPLAGNPGGVLTSGPHDVTVQTIDNTVWAVVSHWNSGLRLLDATNAPTVEEVGIWQGEGATHYGGNVHTAMMLQTNNGTYIVASPEYTSGGNIPSLWVLDANDPSDLKLVAEWWHPGNHTTPGLLLTTHQWQVAPTGPEVNATDMRIYLTMNHGGVWTLDFGKILEGDNQGAILGFHNARSPLDQSTMVGNAVLGSWDVNVVDGHIYASDRATGLWVMQYTGDELGNSALTGFA